MGVENITIKSKKALPPHSGWYVEYTSIQEETVIVGPVVIDSNPVLSDGLAYTNIVTAPHSSSLVTV